MLCRKKIDEGETIPGGTSFDYYKKQKKINDQAKGTDKGARTSLRSIKNQFRINTQGPVRRNIHDRVPGHKTIPDKLKNINDKKSKTN